MDAFLIVIFALLPTELPPPGDETVPAGALQGPSSARLADAVSVRFDAALTDDATPLMPQGGNRARGTSPAPREALNLYTLDVARRHFEQAGWAATGGKGRELVIKSVAVTVSQGPVYNAVVVVDRVQGGRRLGQGTGQGMAWVDRSNDQMAAAFAGPFAGLVAHDAVQPKARKDAAAIRVATLRALDSALLQLAAYWSSEQMQEKALEQQRALQEGGGRKGGRK